MGELCEKNDVRGYPTIKYGDPADLKDYNGGRTFDDLKKFAEENLGPTCGPENLDLCDADTKAMIEKFIAMDEATLDKEIQEANLKVDQIKNKHRKVIASLKDKALERRNGLEKATKKKDDLVKKESAKLGVSIAKKIVSAYKKKELKEEKGGKGKRKKANKKEL